MLVISRRIGESFVIGDNIIATVVDITGEKVVLGVEAPKEIPIERLNAPERGSGKPPTGKRGHSRHQGQDKPQGKS
jgi:carbon storage regulator